MEHPFWSQDQIAITVGAVVLLVVVVLTLLASRKRYGQKLDPKLADDLANGNYEAAAERELKAGRLRTAYDLFLRAQQPLRAAHIAVRQGRLQTAAELLEKAGVRNRAADLYKQLGMTSKAEELLAEEARSPREHDEQRLQREGGDPDGNEVLDLTDRPVAKPAPAARALAEAAKATATATPGPTPKPISVRRPTPAPEPQPDARLQSLPEKAAAQAPSPALAMGATSSRVGFGTSMVSRGLEAEELGLRYASDPAVDLARLGPAVDELQGRLARHGRGAGAEDTLYRLGLALVAAGRWSEARDAFERVDQGVPGYRDAAARAQELVRWQAAVGRTPLSLSRAGGATTRYVLLGELGRGGAAVVYRARHEDLGREVALKLLAQGAADDPGALGLLQSEGEVSAQLDHPNVATVYDVGEQQGRVFIAMELVDGATVAKMIEKEGKLPALAAATIVDQVLDALTLAHAKRAIHRDIKPANIMVRRDGRVKVMDFGLARRAGGPDKATLDASSAPYLAPEQLAGKNIDGRADLFALGVSFYEMLTAKLPFTGLPRHEPAAPMRTLDQKVPPALDGIVMRALELDRNRRFRDAAEMAIPLRAFLASTTPASLSLGDIEPQLQELAFGEAQPAQTTAPGAAKGGTKAWSCAEVQAPVDLKPPVVSFSFEGAESGPVSVPIVEGLPEPIPPESNLTPRTPVPASTSSAGTYRMVRPSQPDVFTPPPGTSSTTRKSGERVAPQKTPTPFPTLKLGAKPTSGERRTDRTPAPATSASPAAGGASPRVPTQTPTPDGGPGGLGPDLGSRSGK